MAGKLINLMMWQQLAIVKGTFDLIAGVSYWVLLMKVR